MRNSYTIIALLVASFALGQIPDKARMEVVKSDPVYHWAVGVGKEHDIALQKADIELMKQVGGVALCQSTIDSIREILKTDTAKLMEEYGRVFKSFAGIYLKGLMHLAYKENRDWTALSYIHKDSLAVSLARSKSKLEDYYKNARQAEKEGRLGGCLRNFYWGFLLANTYEGNKECLSSNGETFSIAKEAFNDALKSALNDIKFKVVDTYQYDERQIVSRLIAFYNGKTIHQLDLKYFGGGGEGEGYTDILDDTINVHLFLKPTSPDYCLNLSIEYIYEIEMEQDAEILGLYDIFKGCVFKNRKSVNLHFDWFKEEKQRREERRMKLEECVQSAQPLFTDVLDLCKSTTDYIELENYLRQYITLEAITVGKPENFPDKKGCLIVIIKGDRASDVLYFDGVEYQSIRNGKTFKDLTRGFELTSQLWFRPNLR